MKYDHGTAAVYSVSATVSYSGTALSVSNTTLIQQGVNNTVAAAAFTPKNWGEA